mmetsp:Transcript_33794/g.49663  ORF Transcript_33794/g.49663 Transcript_33794/m.49663 type:complete len:284 (-) Transcript_33794:512-1363(-)
MDVRCVVHIHAAVPEGVRTERAPRRRRLREAFVHFLRTGGSGHDVNGGVGVDVGVLGQFFVHGEGTLVVVLVAIDPEVKAILVEKRLKVLADFSGVTCRRVVAVVVISGAAVNVTVTVGDHPRHIIAVGVGCLQVFFEPLQLRLEFDADFKANTEPEFGGDGDVVHEAGVPRVVQRVVDTLSGKGGVGRRVGGHVAPAFGEVGEVGRRVLVVAVGDHVRQARRDLLDVVHELVPGLSGVRVKVVRKIADVQEHGGFVDLADETNGRIAGAGFGVADCAAGVAC